MVTNVSPLDAPDRDIYFIGDSIDLTGLTLVVTYSDGTSFIADSGYTVTGSPDMTTSGDYVVVLDYEGFELAIPIRILPEFTFENIRCLYASVTDDTGAGFNQQGENVYWTTLIAFDMEHDLFHAYPPSVTCSWTNTTVECEVLSLSYSFAREGLTVMETLMYPGDRSYSGNNQAFIYLYLPDDPSIEGIQTVTLTVGPYSYTIEMELEYTGDYETGTGWLIYRP